MRPWEDTVVHVCEDGDKGPVVPADDGSPETVCRFRDVKCVSCGKIWMETDDRRLAQIWWSQGAYDGKEWKESEREE